MRSRLPFILSVLILLLCSAIAMAEIQVTAERRDNQTATPDFKFAKIASPSRTDAATSARFTIVDGRLDPNGAGVDTLYDGRGPTNEDEPTENLFFAAGRDGGRILVDLGGPVAIRTVNTYSWHRSTRGPQVYELFAADGKADGFDPQPKRRVDPAQCGWTRLATVDTRRGEGGGGQYGVSISDSKGMIGTYRYLLFDVKRTEATDPFGNTFYSEIDVDDGNVHKAVTPAAPEPRREIVTTEEGNYQITIDTTETPDLTEWAHEELAPVVGEWYPKIVKLLPSEGFEAPRQVVITFSARMRGVAATGGTRVMCAANWMRQNLEGEAKGAVVHELVHVVQQYGRARRRGRGATRTPGWLVEGIADYIRWFLYEPESHGAEIAPRNIDRARYDASYRVSANFLNWVTQNYDKQIVAKLNGTAREGRYSEDFWKQQTGLSLQELGAKWKAALRRPDAVK